jgi:hypothetical protein
MKPNENHNENHPYENPFWQWTCNDIWKKTNEHEQMKTNYVFQLRSIGGCKIFITIIITKKWSWDHGNIMFPIGNHRHSPYHIPHFGGCPRMGRRSSWVQYHPLLGISMANETEHHAEFSTWYMFVGSITNIYMCFFIVFHPPSEHFFLNRAPKSDLCCCCWTVLFQYWWPKSTTHIILLFIVPSCRFVAHVCWTQLAVDPAPISRLMFAVNMSKFLWTAANIDGCLPICYTEYPPWSHILLILSVWRG